jgi:predicted O-methyltransferase YrrM
MNKLAANILRDGFFEGSDKQHIPLHSNTSLAQSEFLLKHLYSIDAVITLEIGLAYGISALCIADAIKDNPGAKHHVIDPFQNTSSWEGWGLKNLERAGLSSIIDFHEGYAQDVLPRLILEGVQVDFAYVDAGKRMDDTLIFAQFLGRLVRVGGLVAFDDLSFPGVRKALRYVVQQQHFRLKDSFGSQKSSLSRRLVESVARRMPGGRHLFASELRLSDVELGIAAQCVVIEKIAEPDDDWRWHSDF